MNQLKISTLIAIIVYLCLGSTPLSAGDQLKQHDPTLAIPMDSAIRQHRQSRILFVDVRNPKAFETLKIPGSINIPLYAIKTKAFLKSSSIVLVNAGYAYSPLEKECRRLIDDGFTVSILDGGINAWRRKGGSLIGDLTALKEIRQVSPQEFLREKDYESALVIDFSWPGTSASQALIANAVHLPVSPQSDASAAELAKEITRRTSESFASVLIVNETGDNYTDIERLMAREKIPAFYLKGGLAGYKTYLQNLSLSWQPRESRIKTVSKCKPCGKKSEGQSAE
ncbi:hypothetical protein D1BOALGB6SA_936 [Olavius sp. associated proteobacterium Delta 1]|nr:hypothetical protein D1BOALGB6SA_936 [Olavius sp. associated proteobacterium Delta 1]